MMDPSGVREGPKRKGSGKKDITQGGRAVNWEGGHSPGGKSKQSVAAKGKVVKKGKGAVEGKKSSPRPEKTGWGKGGLGGGKGPKAEKNSGKWVVRGDRVGKQCSGIRWGRDSGGHERKRGSKEACSAQQPFVCREKKRPWPQAQARPNREPRGPYTPEARTEDQKQTGG